MGPRVTAFLVALALLAPPAVIVDAAMRAGEGRASHDCCPDRLRASCHGETIACCKSNDASSRDATPPTTRSAAAQAPVAQPLAGWGTLADDVMSAARRAACQAHAAARLHAPPDPLFLKHAVLLV